MLGTKPRTQVAAEEQARAARRATTPLEYSAASVESCTRLHLRNTYAADGSLEFTPPFLSHLGAAVNAKRRARAEAADRDALLAPRNWCTPGELARLLAVDSTTIRRAIARGELPSARPGGRYGHHRIAWPDAKAYLATRCGYDAATIAAAEARWAQTMEVYG